MRFIGNCRKCKLAKRFDAIQTKLVKGSAGYGRTTWTRTFNVEAAAPFVGPTFVKEANEHHDRSGKIWLKCPAGHNVEFKRIMGITTDKRCDARCEGATGNCCECSCGGKNHGAAHQ